MRDVNEKYIRLNMDFPNKAGKLASLLEAQKRLLQTLLKKRPDDTTKALIMACAESYDVSHDLIEWMKQTLQGVANDAEALVEGSKIRNINKLQGEEIQRLWEKIEPLQTKSGNSSTRT